MEFSAVFHKADKNYCFALAKNEFLIRIRVKKHDMKQVILHYQDKYLPVEYMDTRAQKEMECVASDAFSEYFETKIQMDLVCLRYFFELVDYEGNRSFYGDYLFHDSLITEIEEMFDCPQNLREEEMFVVPKWAANSIFYQIFPSRYATSHLIDDELWYKEPIGHKDNLQGDLRGIIKHLDYLKDLGIDVIYMTPIFRSDSSHKYDTIDYYQIDPSFGTKEELKELVDKAHAYGMKVILDGVFNHTSPKFFAFADVMEKKEASEYLDWYYIEGFPLVMEWGKRPNFKTFSYFGGMPKLNLSNKKVQDYIIDVATYWLKECKIDGWRLDVGDEVRHDFWKRFRKEVKSVNQEALIIGEVWHYAPDFLEGDEWDTVMNYPFYKAIKDLVADQKIKVSEFCNRIGFLKGNLHTRSGSLLLNMMDSHDTERFLHSCSYNKEKQKLAAAVMLLSQGMPMLYYGDEVGIGGGPDPDCRRGMLWEESRQDKEMLTWYKKLIEIRKRYPGILEGDLVNEIIDDETAVYDLSKEKNGECLHLLFHFDDGQLDYSKYAGKTDLITGETFSGILHSHEVVVLKG